MKERTAELIATNEQLDHEATERKKLEQSFVQRIEWLSALNKIHQKITGMADLPQAYENLSDTILQLLDARTVFVLRWDEQDTQFEMNCRSPSEGSTPALEEIKTIFLRETPLRQDIELGNVILLSADQAAFLPAPLGGCFQGAGFQSLILGPMMIHQAAVGVLGIATSIPVQDFNLLQVDLIERMSFDLASLIDDAVLLDQTRALAMLEERNRLARELHDSVAQALYGISLFTDATRLALDSNRLEIVRQHLGELGELSREAMTDMRLLIFELRPPILEKEGLVAALQSRLDSVEAKAGFQAVFRSEGVFHLSQDQESELYRIAQEALNNVIKHAHADQVRVDLTGVAGRIRLMIEDDGVGFDPETAEQGGGQGFRNMRERADLIGARCSMQSVPGQGTKISVEVKQ
jgi:signal transduction histidine kinase